MKPIERFERILKDLDVCGQLASGGSLAHKTINDKVAAVNVEMAIRKVRRVLQAMYYGFEDAVRPHGDAAAALYDEEGGAS